MNKSIYRNYYYVKESILEFFACNKKHFLFCFIAIIIGVALGLCVAINNMSNFTIINLTNKSLIAIFSGGSLFGFLFSNIIKHLFLVFLILLINNFSFLRFLTYFIFAYLSFALTIDVIIIICVFNIKGILFCLLGYFVINLLLILSLVIISVLCKMSCDCNGNSSKFCCYPYKNIVCISLLSAGLILLLCCISKIFTNFIVIIV